MTKYAAFDADGFPVAFYTPELHGAKGSPGSMIPLDATEITDAQWQEFIDNTGYRRWDGAGLAHVEPLAQPPATLALCQVAAARLHIEGWDISGIERSQGIGAAMMIDENTAWILFADAQPDTNYIVTPGDGVTKTVDYIEILCPGVVDLALIVQRVQ